LQNVGELKVTAESLDEDERDQLLNKPEHVEYAEVLDNGEHKETELHRYRYLFGEFVYGKLLNI